IESPNLRQRLLLNKPGACYQVGKTVRVREAGKPGQIGGGNERRKGSLIRNRIQKQKIVSDSISAPDHRLGAALRTPRETKPWPPVDLRLVRRLAKDEASQRTSSRHPDWVGAIEVQV